eukprot:8149633-Pyramimonas_sp.AAC.1
MAVPETLRDVPCPAHTPTKSVSPGTPPSLQHAAALPCTSHPGSDKSLWLRRTAEVRIVRLSDSSLRDIDAFFPLYTCHTPAHYFLR